MNPIISLGKNHELLRIGKIHPGAQTELDDGKAKSNIFSKTWSRIYVVDMAFIHNTDGVLRPDRKYIGDTMRAAAPCGYRQTAHSKSSTQRIDIRKNSTIELTRQRKGGNKAEAASAMETTTEERQPKRRAAETNFCILRHEREQHQARMPESTRLKTAPVLPLQ